MRKLFIILAILTITLFLAGIGLAYLSSKAANSIYLTNSSSNLKLKVNGTAKSVYLYLMALKWGVFSIKGVAVWNELNQGGLGRYDLFTIKTFNIMLVDSPQKRGLFALTADGAIISSSNFEVKDSQGVLKLYFDPDAFKQLSPDEKIRIVNDRIVSGIFDAARYARNDKNDIKTEKTLRKKLNEAPINQVSFFLIED